MNKACFLDRDGVINEEICYLHEAEKTVLTPTIVEALRKIHAAGFLAIVVTNQAGVAKSYYPESDIAIVHARIQELLAAQNEKIDDFFHCPHHPEFTEKCNCRKPAPGMILAAAEKWNIDLSASFIIGDRISDVNAGINAGIGVQYLVLTGYGKNAAATVEAAKMNIAETPLAAVEDFFSQHR